MRRIPLLLVLLSYCNDKMTSVHANKSYTQDSLLQNGSKNSYGISPDATHVWIPSGEKNGTAAEKTGINRNVSTVGNSGKGSTLTIHDINYTVKVKTKACCGKTEDKAILKGVEYVFTSIYTCTIFIVIGMFGDRIDHFTHIQAEQSFFECQ